MKYLGFFALLLTTTFIFNSCGDDAPEPTDPCANSQCVNGDCVNGSCDCLEAYKGALCDEEKTPSRIIVTKMVIKNFPAMDGQKTWDDPQTDDSGAEPDITIEVSDLIRSYFKAKDLTTQLHEDAKQGQNYEISCENCNDKLFGIDQSTDTEDFTNQLTFTLVDQDFVDNIENMYFMGSIKTDFKDLWPGFPKVYELSSATGSIKIDLHVRYEY